MTICNNQDENTTRINGRKAQFQRYKMTWLGEKNTRQQQSMTESQLE